MELPYIELPPYIEFPYMLELPAYEVDAGEMLVLVVPLTGADAEELVAGLADAAADAGTAAPAAGTLFRSQGFGGAACINRPPIGHPNLRLAAALCHRGF